MVTAPYLLCGLVHAHDIREPGDTLLESFGDTVKVGHCFEEVGLQYRAHIGLIDEHFNELLPLLCTRTVSNKPITTGNHQLVDASTIVPLVDAPPKLRRCVYQRRSSGCIYQPFVYPTTVKQRTDFVQVHQRLFDPAPEETRTLARLRLVEQTK